MTVEIHFSMGQNINKNGVVGGVQSLLQMSLENDFTMDQNINKKGVVGGVLNSNILFIFEKWSYNIIHHSMGQTINESVVVGGA